MLCCCVTLSKHVGVASTLKLVRGRVNNQVTNGSKAAVMDVIGFVRVSLGSSTVQLHNSLGSRCACACTEAGFGSQNGDCA
jgi:hypothetical protein